MSKLQIIRTNAHLSCADMAKKLHISKVHYWQIEKKKRKLYYNMAMKIAKIFKTTPDDLFYEDYLD